MGRLVLTLKLDESVTVGDNITLTICKIKGKTIRLSIEAPKKIPVSRERTTVKSREQPGQRTVATRAGEP